MLILVTALHCEAKPLIDHYHLKRLDSRNGRDVFAGEGVRLAISGVGKMKSAAATALALEGCCAEASHAINVGICAGTNDFALGEALLAHKIVDAGSGRSFFPDIVYKHPLKEAVLHTVDAPQGAAPENFSGLIDMEASGFFSSASAYLPPSRIAAVKVVGDHFNIGRPSRAFVEDLIRSNIVAISRLAECVAGASPAEKAAICEEDRLLLSGIESRLRLTVSQRHRLNQTASGFKSRRGDLQSRLSPFRDITAENKKERADALRRITDSLAE